MTHEDGVACCNQCKRWGHSTLIERAQDMTETQEFQEIGKRLEDVQEHILTIKREINLIERHLEEGMNHLAAIVQRRLEP